MILQTVTINGTPALIRDCSVSRSFSQRVGRVTLTVERDVAPAVFDALALGQAVQVTRTDGTTTETTDAIVYQIEEARPGGAPIRTVTCRTQEVLAQHIRFLGDWQDMPAGDVVAHLVTEYGAEVGLSVGTIADAGRTVAEVTSRYDSLYDCLEQVSQQTGLVWEVVGGAVNLFDPETRTSPAIDAGSFIDGSLSVRRDLDGVVNVARMQAWQYVDIDICGEPCFTFRNLSEELPGYGWELAGEIEESPLFFPSQFNVDAEAKRAEWSQSSWPFYARFKMRQLVWVEMWDAGSIAAYGRIDAPPLWHDGGTNVDAAVETLAEYLRKKSRPYAVVGCQPQADGDGGLGFSPDSQVALSLSAYGVDVDSYVTDVTTTFGRDGLTVRVQAVSNEGVT